MKHTARQRRACHFGRRASLQRGRSGVLVARGDARSRPSSPACECSEETRFLFTTVQAVLRRIALFCLKRWPGIISLSFQERSECRSEYSVTGAAEISANRRDQCPDTAGSSGNDQTLLEGCAHSQHAGEGQWFSGRSKAGNVYQRGSADGQRLWAMGHRSRERQLQLAASLLRSQSSRSRCRAAISLFICAQYPSFGPRVTSRGNYGNISAPLQRTYDGRPAGFQLPQ